MNKEILQRLINIEQEIYILFLELADLEIKELADTNDYQSKLELLEQKLQEENFCFNHKTLDIECMLELSEFFEGEIKTEYFHSSLNEYDIERIYVRALQLLEYQIDLDVLEDEIKVVMPSDKEINIENIIKYIFPTRRKLYKKYYEMIFEKKALSYSLNDRLYNLQQAIENEKDKYTKINLQTIKYLITFCDSPLTENITPILSKGPLTQIIHEQIAQDSSELRANITSFLSTIEDIMYEDANDFIDDLLVIENNPAGKKATIAELKAVLPYLSKTNLEIINDCFKEDQDTITKIEIKEIVQNELENRSYYNVGKTEIKPEIQLELTEERIDLIKNLINIDHSIYQIYEHLITLKSEDKENTKEFQNWLNNLKDAYELEKQYLNQIKVDYEYILQFSLALNRDNLHLYHDKEIDKMELINIKARINSYIEPIYNDLLIKELFQNHNNKRLQKELIKEQKDNDLIQILKKVCHTETYKAVENEIKKYEGNTKKELINDQFSTAFTNYFFTNTLIETKFDSEKLPQINSDYLYIISLELGVDYNYLEYKINEFMYETALQFSELAQEMQTEEGDYSKGYRNFLQAQVKAALPFLSEEQLRQLGYKNEKKLIK